MLLYLVRHGKAEATGEDAGRRLTPEGWAAVQRVAQRLHDAGVRVDRIEHSGLARAGQTAGILAQALDGSTVAVADLGSSAPVAPVERRLRREGDRNIMLVGHIPFMERLASYLLTGDAERETLHVRTGSVACFSRDVNGWLLEWFLPPEMA